MTQPPRSPEELRRYAEETAATLGLAVAPADWPAVLGVLANLARVAAPLLAFPLPDDAEPAPVFTAGAAEPESR
jgi:1-carboxybiuret hydrolase subunit AtzG-like